MRLSSRLLLAASILCLAVVGWFVVRDFELSASACNHDVQAWMRHEFALDDAAMARIASLQEQVDQETGKIVGDRRSLAGEIEQYQALLLEDQYASKRLSVAMAALQEAEAEARRKHAYVERIAQPSLPDEAEEPRRWRGILATLVLGCVAWGIMALLLAGVREHRD